MSLIMGAGSLLVGLIVFGLICEIGKMILRSFQLFGRTVAEEEERVCR